MLYWVALSSFLIDPTLVAAVTNITFLHMNDHHSHFDELSFDITDPAFLSPDLTVSTSELRIYYGGFPRLASLMKLREDEGTLAGSPVVKIHAGDAMTGTVFYTFFGPDMDAAAMNAIGFDAFVPGNHEFDEGDGNLADFVGQLNFSAVSYNGKCTASHVVSTWFWILCSTYWMIFIVSVLVCS
jgi:5'-nucleotidase